MDAQLLHQGLAAAMALSSAANQYVDARAPWTQAKDPDRAGELDVTLASLARCVAALGTMLQPFMPGRMADLSPSASASRPSRPSIGWLPST
jgi:methionyl-tRNA synthetase